MRIALLTLLTLALATAPVAADAFDSSPYKYRKPIEVSDQIAGRYALVELDGEVFDAARRDLADLRLVNAAGEQVPYKLLSTAPEWATRSFELTPLNLVERGDRSLSLEFELPPELELHNQLTLDTPESNFRCQVDVDALIDDQWSSLGRGLGIFDFTGAVQARYLKLRYPETSARRLRLVVNCERAAIVRPTSATIERRAWREARLSELRPVLLSSMVDPDARTSTLRYDLGHVYPLSQIEFTIQGIDFSRPVQVFALKDVDSWQPVAASRIFSIHTELFRAADLLIDFNETWTREIKIVIDDGDNPPLKVERLQAFAAGRYLYFPAVPGQRLWLLFGAPEAQPPVYDFAEVYLFLPDERPPALSTGAAEDNPDYHPQSTTPRDLKPILTLVLIAAVLILAWLIFRLARKSDASK